MFRLFKTSAGLLLFVVSAFAAPKIEPLAGGGFAVKAKGYEASVAADGYLTQVRVGGEAFLKPGVDISRGTYFYQKGVVTLAQGTRLEGAAVVSEGPLARVRYSFADASMTWTVDNRSDQPMVFFAILPETVGLAAGSDGVVVGLPAERQWTSSRWFGEVSKLSFVTKGSTRQWVWRGNLMVWEVALGPRETRVVEVEVAPINEAERAAIRKLRPELGDLRVAVPRELEVFQRRTADEGMARVAGRMLSQADVVRFRFTGKDRKGGALPGEWQEAKVGPDGSYAAEVALAAGGWYQLELVALKGGSRVAEQRVARVGMGEVFVGSGQSNSTSCGGHGSKNPLDGRIQPVSGMVSTFDGRVWRIADDPQPGAHDSHTAGSFWPAFGDAMHARFGVPIGVAVTGHGGTSINAWKTNGELFNWTLARIAALESGRQGGVRSRTGFRALLWHQGESDAKTMDAAGYSGGLGLIIKDMRTRAGWKFPWFVAQATYHPGMPPFAGVRAGQKKLWTSGLALEGPDTDAMVGELRDNGGKGIHFSKKGLKVHGEAWAEKVGDWLEKELRR